MLRRGILVALMFVAILFGACISQPNFPMATHTDPLTCRTIPGNPSHERPCVLITRNRGDLWFVVGDREYSDNQIIEGLSFMGGGNGPASFGNFSISPGGSYLAVIIAEEGHPTLLFTPLQQVLQGYAESVDLPVIPTYPGSLGIEGWQSDDRIIVSSDQDLVDYQHGGELGEFRSYLVHLPDGKITRQD